MFAVFVTNHTGTSSFSVSNAAVEGFLDYGPLSGGGLGSCTHRGMYVDVGHSAHASFRMHVPWCTHDQNVTYTEGGCLEGCGLLEGVVGISTKLSGEVAQ